MPRIAFDSKFKAESVFDYPKLFLDKGERVRIVCIEQEPEFEYVHTLRAPEVMNGKPVYETVQNKEGQEEQALKYNFVGRYICPGSIPIIQEKGSDKDACVICAESHNSDAVRPPERRFAMHVIKYSTKPGTFEVASPYQVQVLAWTFADGVFNSLVDIANEWGDIRQHDINLGPCTVKKYQKFDMQVAAKAAWLSSEENKKLTTEVYKEGRCKDLSALIGRKVSKDILETELERVLRNYRICFSTDAPQVDMTGLGDNVKVDVDDILEAPFSPENDAKAKSLDETTDAFADLGAEKEDSPVTPAQEDSPESPETEPPTFDDLLKL